MIETIPHKRCTGCGVLQSTDSFHRSKSTKDGLAYTCKSCVRIRTDAHYAANREVVKAKTRAYANAHPDQRRARSREYARRNQKANAARTKAWRAKNIEWSRELTRARRRRLTPLDPALIMQRFEVYGNACAYCGLTGRLEVDHVKALDNGGRHILSNLRPACRTCNSSKHTRRLNDWLSDPKRLSGQPPQLLLPPALP